MATEVENAFAGVFSILQQQQKALEQMLLDLGDVVQRAEPYVKNARAMIEMAIVLGNAAEAAKAGQS